MNETVGFVERIAETIHMGLRPDNAALEACRLAGKAATVTWLQENGKRVSGHWTLARLAAGVVNVLLAQRDAWEAIEANQIREGSFIVADEDALIAMTGRDREGQAPDDVYLHGPEDVNWASVVEDGMRADRVVPGTVIVELQEVRGSYVRTEGIYAYGKVLRLRAVGDRVL